jgi:hypothetical protein
VFPLESGIVPADHVRLTKDEVIYNMTQGVYANDPAQWVPDATGYVLDEWQKRVFRKLFKVDGKGRMSVAASHGAGKTLIAGLLTHYFLCNFIPSKVAITGPTGKQTRAQVWSYISAVWNRSVFKEDISWYRTKMAMKIAEEEWFATWLTSKEPKSIEGFHGPDDGKNLLWIVEESKGVADGVFEAIQGALSHLHNYWYISSTCGVASGFFFDTHNLKRAEWETERVPYTESSRISIEQVKKWAATWGRDSPIFRARVMAEFPEEDEKIIVPLVWYDRAIERRDEPDELEEAA